MFFLFGSLTGDNLTEFSWNSKFHLHSDMWQTKTLKNDKGNIYLLCIHKGRVRRGLLKIYHVFEDSIILSNRSIVHFCGWWKWEGYFLAIFSGCYKWVTSKTIIIYKKNVWNQNASNIPENFNLIIRHMVI